MTGASLIAIMAVGAFSVYGIMGRKIGGVEVQESEFVEMVRNGIPKINCIRFGVLA